MCSIRLLYLLVAVAATLAACKKDGPANSGNSGGQADSLTANTLANRVKDSSLAYARDIYLWYTQIPASFNPRTYADPNAIMRAIRAFSREPGFTDPVDRWSFAALKRDWDNVSAGIAQDFGLYVFFRAEGDLRVRLVEKNSPAEAAGIRRGWRVRSINGNSSLSTANANSIIQAVYQSASTRFRFERADGTETDITLNAATYSSQPVLLDSIYTAGSRRLGYLVFNSFLGDTTRIFADFERIFNRWAAAGVNEVAIDLRYNGGGFVHVQRKLANWLAPSGANGQVLMSQQFNDRYTRFNETWRFQKLGSLQLSRLFFVVSGSTASASEMLINNMRPHLDVRVVGPAASFGKPVGYFPIPVGDWYVFPVSIRSTNSAGQGNYFTGFAPDRVTPDEIDKDWGRSDEACLAAILRFVGTGTFGAAFRDPQLGTATQLQLGRANQGLEGPRFNGAVSWPPATSFR